MKKLSIVERLNRQQKEEVYESKLRFFTNITHEFCTPLTLIHGPCEKLLSYSGSNPYINKYATLIRHNAERLNQLIQELIEFRRLETGNRQPEIKQVSLSLLVEQLAASFYELAESRGITYRVEIDKEITWNTDTACLFKIVNNLLSNAFKYVNTGGTVLMKVFVINQLLHLHVTNTGKGIRKEQIPEIFDRYKILDNFELQNKGWDTRNGLGLAICHSMVKLLGGDIHVTSEPDRETTFTVVLPALAVVLSAGNRVEEEPLAPPMDFPLNLEEEVEEPDQKSPTLLIIDDDPSMLWFITEVFREHYNVVPMNNSTEVSRYLECNQPDLIISDIMMPEIDGISIARMIRSNPLTNHIPLIHLSAKITIEDQVRGIESGSDVYITKPFNVEYLEKVVKRLLQQKKDLKQYYNSALSALEIKDGQFIYKEEKETFEKLMVIIEKNISDPELSVDLLSSSLGISSRQLYRKTKAMADKTPADLIKEYRFSLVEKLLITTQLSIDEILYRTGFANRGNFFKAFSARYGTTPKRFREMKREEAGFEVKPNE
ncbi:MAG: response regulator [Bacteroides sp.]|nr:response regulator [Bacteroides sp.]